MRLRSLVKGWRSAPPSISAAPVQPDIDASAASTSDASGTLKVPGETGIDVSGIFLRPPPDESGGIEIGIAAAKRRAGIVDPYAHVSGSCCLTRFYTPLQHAAQLLAYVVLFEFRAEETPESFDLECAHGHMVGELHWVCRPWNPVARELRLLTTGRKVYRRRTDEPPIGQRKRVYPMPSAADAAAVCDRVLGHCSLFVPETERGCLWPGPPPAPICTHTVQPCPMWRPWHGARK